MGMEMGMGWGWGNWEKGEGFESPGEGGWR